jgi:hypothetical protein|tara:strand:- start:734 stop:913 length:180 start_codon:yes stop_codon:yes gene_type:complete
MSAMSASAILLLLLCIICLLAIIAMKANDIYKELRRASHFYSSTHGKGDSFLDRLRKAT